MSRKAISILIWLLISFHSAFAQEVRIGVLGLYRPQELILTAPVGAVVVLQAGSDSIVLGASAGHDLARITTFRDELLLEVGEVKISAHEIHAASPAGTAVEFQLAISGKICRSYVGTLDVRTSSGVLEPVVDMDLETAVASAVLAESAPEAPIEALKAQAVATRSYYISAKARHPHYDFCDTTHCQFLREPPSEQSDSWRAAMATRGFVLEYLGKPITAMFTRSCGGATRTPADLSMTTAGYPYFAVVCAYCRKMPVRWQTRVSLEDVRELIQGGEAGRLRIDRRLGWSVVPSNNFSMHAENSRIELEGAGEGHGIGMCQRGATYMAKAGARYREILDYYYPNTDIAIADSVSVQPRRMRLTQ